LHGGPFVVIGVDRWKNRYANPDTGADANWMQPDAKIFSAICQTASKRSAAAYKSSSTPNDGTE
jgi:hypothetical protein